MTVIALKDGILAGDRACNRNGVRTGYRAKVRRVDGGRVAMTGYLPACLSIVEWIEGGRVNDAPKGVAGDEWGAVIFVPDEGDPTLIEQGLESPLPDAPFHAWGMGREIALGVMWQGGTAEEAVLAAIELEIHCDGGPDVLGPEEAE